MKILIVEDDRTLNNGIALSLNSDDILQAFCIEEAEKLLDSSINLIILDINLPDGSGLDFCRKIRETSKIPIIFLTANDMEIDIVTGLETGADDYITKPFSLAVLRARVNAVSRRRHNDGNVFRLGKYEFDFDNMKFLAGNTPVELSKTEQRLLKIFVQNQGRTLSREMLIDRVWSDGAEFVEENALSVTVKRLRQKLAGVPIKSVYGIGYVWEKEK
ncbi:MAG: response regulator transcription factor [Clostridia bacterium]|nr:response regulator transcription factor [Clostridia bacterium]